MNRVTYMGSFFVPLAGLRIKNTFPYQSITQNRKNADLPKPDFILISEMPTQESPIAQTCARCGIRYIRMILIENEIAITAGRRMCFLCH